jgi:hypothetical protein
MVGAAEQPMQPGIDCDKAQQGAPSRQQTVNGAATAPSDIHASSAIAARRYSVRRRESMSSSLAGGAAVVRAGGKCDAQRFRSEAGDGGPSAARDAGARPLQRVVGPHS